MSPSSAPDGPVVGPLQQTRPEQAVGCKRSVWTSVSNPWARSQARIPASLSSSANLPSVIRFEKVTKTYPGGSHPALDNVSIDIEKGEFVFLVGASGSGKSTALRLVLRESRCTSGRVYVAGK